MDAPDEGVIHVLGRTGWDGEKFRRITQNGTLFKTSELFIFGIFHLIFPDHSRPWVTTTHCGSIENHKMFALSRLAHFAYHNTFNHLVACVRISRL